MQHKAIQNKLYSGFYRIMFAFMLIAVGMLMPGCARSAISIERAESGSDYPMYGKTASRNFNYDGTVSDSLKFLWQAEINGSTPVSSVVGYGKYVFLNDLSGRIYCFNVNTGKTAGQLKHKGSIYTAPVVENIIMVYAVAINDRNKSDLVFYDFINARTIAEVNEIDGRVLTHLIKAEDGVIFITENGKIYKYTYTGIKIFEYATKAVTHSSPAFSNNILVFGNDKGEITGFNVKDQKIVYKEKISDLYLSGISISGGTAYAGDYNGILYAVDINTGKVLWQYNTGKRIDMVPAFDDTRIYVGNLGGEMFAINKSDGSLIWKSYTDGILNAAPLVTDNLIIQSDVNKKIHFFLKDDGTRKKILELDGRAKLTPVYLNNILFIGYDDGILEAYEIIK